VSDSADQLPEDRRGDLTKARRLAWITIVYLTTNTLVLFAAMGSSQAVKTELISDVLSLFAPVLFLVGDKVSARPPSERYPYGFARAVTAGYLGAVVALVGVGGYLLFDSVMKLIAAERPQFGSIAIGDQVIWRGWLALPALAWSCIPAVFLGRAKEKLGVRLHDKIVLADAGTNAADWQSAGAAMIGVLGIAAGLWWLDAVAAAFISLEIIRSGISEVRSAVGDLMDRRPEDLEGEGFDPLPKKVTAYLQAQPWVADAVVRVREEGRRFTGEAFVVPREDQVATERIGQASRGACELDWRLQEMLITPVREIPRSLEPVRAGTNGDGGR
jgi:cation diffusion facilitator family transporter